MIESSGFGAIRLPVRRGLVAASADVFVDTTCMSPGDRHALLNAVAARDSDKRERIISCTLATVSVDVLRVSTSCFGRSPHLARPL